MTTPGRAYFRENRHLVEELRNDSSVQHELGLHAERGKGIAEQLAPIGASRDYVNSFVVVRRGGHVYLATTDFAGAIIEWGSIHNPPYATLRRAARRLGLRFVELHR